MHPFETRLAQSWPPATWRDVTVVIAVSGGADSVALLHGLKALDQGGAGELIAAHFDHRLRAESGEDAAFVRDLAEEIGCRAEIGVASQPTRSAGDGLEAAAREARYDFFRETARRLGARFVVTAHTADDQAETVLQRLIRGTGLHGAAGIPRARELMDGKPCCQGKL